MINVLFVFTQRAVNLMKKKKKTREEKKIKKKTSTSSSSLLLFIIVVVHSVDKIEVLLLLFDITFVFAFDNYILNIYVFFLFN